MAQEKRLSDTPWSTLEGYGEGPHRAVNGQDWWAFSRMHRALDGWMLARAPASPAQDLHHYGPRYTIFPYFCARADIENRRAKLARRSS